MNKVLLNSPEKSMQKMKKAKKSKDNPNYSLSKVEKVVGTLISREFGITDTDVLYCIAAFGLIATPAVLWDIIVDRYERREGSRARILEFLFIWVNNFLARDFFPKKQKILRSGSDAGGGRIALNSSSLTTKSLLVQLIEFVQQIEDLPTPDGLPSWKHQLNLAIWRNKPCYLIQRGRGIFNSKKSPMKRTSSLYKIPNSADKHSSTSKLVAPPVLDMLESKTIEANQFADQLTLIEWNMFRKIKVRELYRLAWKSPERQEVSPHIVSLVDHFNRVSYWTATEIVMKMDLKERAAALKKFITIAERCHELGNYNTLLEVLAGLNMSAIKRLKHTWAIIPDKFKASLADLNESMSTASNYKNYRDELSKKNLPFLPYLGIFLRDITFIEDGNTDLNPNNSINYEKLSLLGQIFSKISQCQLSDYSNLVPNPAIQQYILFAPNLPEEVIYIQSITCEPLENQAE